MIGLGPLLSGRLGSALPDWRPFDMQRGNGQYRPR